MVLDATPEAWAAAISLGAAGLVGAYVKLRSIGKDAKQGREDGEAVKDQVENGHTSNLREDLTEVKRQTHLNATYLRENVSEQLQGLTEGFGEVLSEMRGLRSDVSEERQARHHDMSEERTARRMAIKGLEGKMDDIRQHMPDGGSP